MCLFLYTFLGTVGYNERYYKSPDSAGDDIRGLTSSDFDVNDPLTCTQYEDWSIDSLGWIWIEPRKYKPSRLLRNLAGHREFNGV
jgi:hypothetical protein